MAVTVSRPSGKRLDDVRSLRFRFRTLAFSGNYATGGESITAQAVGMKQVYAVIPLDTMVRAAAGTTGVQPVFDIASDFRSFTVRMLEDAAGVAGATIGVEKNNAEAYIAGSQINVLVLGS